MGWHPDGRPDRVVSWSNDPFSDIEDAIAAAGGPFGRPALGWRGKPSFGFVAKAAVDTRRAPPMKLCFSVLPSALFLGTLTLGACGGRPPQPPPPEPPGHRVEGADRLPVQEPVQEHGDGKSTRLPIHMNATNVGEVVKPQGGASVRDVIRRNLLAVDERAQGSRSRQQLRDHRSARMAGTAQSLPSCHRHAPYQQLSRYHGTSPGYVPRGEL